MSDEQWAALETLCTQRGWLAPRPSSLVQRALRAAGFIDAFAARGLSAERSSVEPSTLAALPPPTCWIGARVDYLMLSSAAASGAAAVDVRTHETVASEASDHLPVYVDVDLPDDLPLQWRG